MKHKKLIAVLSALFMSATLVSPALADASGTSSAGEVNITFDDYAEGTDVTTIPGFSKGDGDTGTATVAYLDGDTSNKVMKVTGHFETPVGLSLKLLNSEATTGRYKLSFREYAINDGGINGILVELPYNKATGHQPVFRLHTAYRNGGLSNFVPSQANWVLYNGWTTFEYLIDLDEKSISVKITDADGTVIQEDTGIADNSSEENTADNYRFLKSLQNLRFRMWSDEEYYFDDIKLERQKISLNDNSVSYLLKDGASFSGKSGVSPDVKTIVLDFGETLSDNVEGCVSLEKSGVPVDFVGVSDGSKYRLELAESLSQSSEYVLKVSPDVTGETGAELGEEFVFTFTTGEKNVIVSRLDFNDCKSAADIKKSGFYWSEAGAVSVGKPEGSSASEDNSVKLDIVEYGVKYDIFHNDVTAGTYKIEYRIFYNASTTVVDLPMSMPGFDKGCLLLALTDANGIGLTFTGSRVYADAEVSYGNWYRCEHLVDFNSRELSTRIYDNSGTPLGDYVTIPFESMDTKFPDSNIDHIKGIRVRNWSETDPAYFDDFAVYRYYKPLSVSESKISYDFLDGTSGRGTDGVDPRVKSIVLDLGGEVSDDSADAITLTKDGMPVPFTARGEGSKYYLDLNGVLEPNSTYTLTVTTELKNADGENIANGLVYTFTTKDAEVQAYINSVKCNGKTVTSISDVMPNSRLVTEVKCANTTLQPKNLTLIVACFDEKSNMISVKIDSSLVAAAMSTDTFSVAVNSVPSGTAKIQAMLVDSVNAMVPYGNFVNITK